MVLGTEVAVGGPKSTSQRAVSDGQVHLGISTILA